MVRSKITDQKTVSQKLAEKTMQELARPRRTQARSRVWKDPEGYKYLVQWSNTVLLRFLIRLTTNNLPRSEYRRKAQLDDAGRSVVRNVEEGYKRSTTSEYLQFIGYSQGSLEEVKGDIRELTEDGFLRSVPGSTLADIGLDLGSFHRALRKTKGGYRTAKDDKGKSKKLEETNKETASPLKSSNHPLTSSKTKEKPWDYRPLTTLYPPLSKVQAEGLTYEIFLELINKTDYVLRHLVESLEKKLAEDQKYYQIEKARIQNNLKRKR